MNTDTRAIDGLIFVALISFAPPTGARDESEYDAFDSMDTAREWGERQLREQVAECGSGWDFRVDVARVARADYDADTWAVADDPVARATWDTATGAVVWQNDGPFDFADYGM
ncbi:hypothetical protein [Nocardia otitidiscaviarum]|uniref:hypothetical protein n=1 Tax=Nocardia otitidiscaviarum TaxID=1823 RepID=UPI001894031A|nr:hypothetical protein [Nocardia otitidiscaviarum]MBF6183350.1 hypothetical protein [Nocardia otitidiscaviarum]